ncbi:tetraacyldisaccharide 4'-kinase [Flavobacterium suaedae]|uniref:Tetraacyldisaccharide 4'-kinase n=1 Tax=Flavobacterium suaedae TaxID=1767027 RepID=A0ABQ1JUP1_9FLAO|nr:tetraacyldisaccharide 4'-kinase [Flavobacterium suaedae]GGB74991.1 tetraacyldisaccharide 4'-kinase [Flavobacterium suaedae]
MKFLRKLLFPFALIYGGVVYLRNFLYDVSFLKSYSFDLPVIVVGNLSVGGTGKSPQTEYLIRLLASEYKVATLSRGYKRKTKGFVLADENADAYTLGDEPFQFHTKFPEITVAVDADRKNGIENLLAQPEPPEVILMDDAYQHRRVKGGFYILLTAFNDIYADDFILPVGNLREGKPGAKRADVIIVTKCPSDLTEPEQEFIINRLKPEENQKIYFSFIEYDEAAISKTSSIAVNELKEKDKILLAGIAKPEPFFNYLKKEGDNCLRYPDHHYFSEKEIEELKKLSKDKIIVTTEKDYMRLKGKLPDDRLFYLPIKSSFINGGDDFNKTILYYVGQSTADGRIYKD